VFAAVAILIVGCTGMPSSVEKAGHDSRELASGRVLEGEVNEPVIRAEVLGVQRPARLRKVKGTCYIIRDTEGSMNAEEGALLEDADLLDFGGECSRVDIESGDELIKLPRKGIRFYRVEIQSN
jgi:hypothetical protein